MRQVAQLEVAHVEGGLQRDLAQLGRVQDVEVGRTLGAVQQQRGERRQDGVVAVTEAAELVAAHGLEAGAAGEGEAELALVNGPLAKHRVLRIEDAELRQRQMEGTALALDVAQRELLQQRRVVLGEGEALQTDACELEADERGEAHAVGGEVELLGLITVLRANRQPLQPRESGGDPFELVL